MDIKKRIEKLEIRKRFSQTQEERKHKPMSKEEKAKVWELLVECGALPPLGQCRKELEHRISQGLDVNNIGEFEWRDNALVILAEIEEIEEKKNLPDNVINLHDK